MNKKGFTLIEIIVSLAIIGIILVGGFSIIGNNFNFLRRSRDMSVDTLLTQQDIELEISSIKSQLKNPLHGLTLKNISIDGVNIGYYSVSKPYNGVNYKFNVTPEQLPEYILLKTFNVKATLKSNTANAFSVYPIDSSSALGTSTPDAATYSTHWMLDINQWYVSRPGFNIPVPKGPVNTPNFKYYDYLIGEGLEAELGTKYPGFPEDYILLGTATSKTLANLNKFAGRHLIYKVTGAAKSGRLGIPEYSDPIFVNGLTRLDNLVVHLDASMIDPSYKDSSNSSHVVSNKVATWLDLSSGIGLALPSQSGTQTNNSNRPSLVDGDIETEFIGRYVTFDTGQSINLNGQGTNGKWLYAFAVVNGNNNAIVFSNNSNSLSINNTEARNLVGNWKLISKEYKSDSNNFIIGNNKIDIGEIIIYSFDTKLNSTELKDISDYVYDFAQSKYLPLNTIWEIDAMQPVSDEVFVGTPYTAQSFANALLTNGTYKYVPVVWENGGVIDTSTPGVATLNGYASADSTKTITLTLTIKKIPVESVDIVLDEVTKDLNDEPFTLDFVVAPVDATNKSITWKSSKTNVATVDLNTGLITPVGVGMAIITATSVDDTSIKDTVIITVSEPIIINTASLNIMPPVDGSKPQSPEQIELATSSEDYKVTNVNWTGWLNNGNFRAGVVYTATITLQSKEGRKFQTSPFTPSIVGAESVGTTTTSGGNVVGNKVTFTITYAEIPSIPIDITTANVVITAPVRQTYPDTIAQVELATNNSDYTVTNVVWNESLNSNNRFRKNTVYSATLTLKSKNNKKFQSEAFIPIVVGSSSVSVTQTNGGNIVGNTVTFIVTFPKTGN